MAWRASGERDHSYRKQLDTGAGNWKGNGQGRGRGRGREGTDIGRGKDSIVCRHWKKGICQFGVRCNFSHDPPLSHRARERPEDSPEEEQAKADYHSWKRLIKVSPRPNDVTTTGLLWSGAFAILNGGGQDCKQKLPLDLDDVENFGRKHIGTLLSMET